LTKVKLDVPAHYSLEKYFLQSNLQVSAYNFKREKGKSAEVAHRMLEMNK